MNLLSKHWGRTCLVASLAALGVLVLLFEASAAQPAGGKPSKPKHLPSAEDIFTNNLVLRIELEIPEPAVEILGSYRWEAFASAQGKRPSVKAIVREGDKVYRDVAIHMKGAAGSFRSIDDRPCLTLNFDKHVKGQTFHGLERISLNNSVQDRSFLNEQVSRELFASVGVAVPRATQARVSLNGRDLGVYVLVEAANKQFLARWFKNPTGNLYDGGFVKDVTDDLVKSSGKDPNDRSDLRRLADAATTPDLTNRVKELEKVLDVDRFLTYLALDVLICDWDGYALNRNNYRLYHDPDSDKFYFIPHGLDQMFGTMRRGPDMTIYPRMSGLVAQGLLQTTEGWQRYRERLGQLMKSVYQVEALTNRVWQLAGKVRPVVAEKGPSAVRSYERQVQAFCERICERAQSIHEQLAAPDRFLKFDTAGVARLSNWQARVDSGKTIVDETAERGRKLLHASARNGSCVGVWTTRISLEPGHYRLEARAKAKGVVPDAGDRRGGVGLRAGDRRMAQKLLGDSDWTNLVLEFDVGAPVPQFGFGGGMEEGVPEVELICELRAAKGEAWFDRDSIRLLRK